MSSEDRENVFRALVLLGTLVVITALIAVITHQNREPVWAVTPYQDAVLRDMFRNDPAGYKDGLRAVEYTNRELYGE